MAEAFYEDEDNLKKLCDFLRGKEGPAVREAIEMDKRVYYLKGESSESVGSPSGKKCGKCNMWECIRLHVRGLRFIHSAHVSNH